MKRILFLILGIIISIVSLYFAFRGFDWEQVWAATDRVRPIFFALMLVPYVLTFMAKVWRWRVLFHPDERRVSFGLLFSTLMISYIPLPFRAGEVARGIIAGARSGIPAPRVFSTIFVEKVLDVLTLLLLLGISLPFVGLPSTFQNQAVVLGIAVLALALILMGLVLRPELARKLIGILSARLPQRLSTRIEAATTQVLEGLAPLSNPPVALRLVLWSLATWGLNVLAMYLLLLTFNIEITPLAAAVLVVVTNLSMAVPSAPGYVGPFELAVVTVLGAFGQPPEVTQSFAIIYHVIGLVPVAIMGVIAAIQQGAGLAAFRAASPTSEASAQLKTATPQAVPTARDKP